MTSRCRSSAASPPWRTMASNKGERRAAHCVQQGQAIFMFFLLSSFYFVVKHFQIHRHCTVWKSGRASKGQQSSCSSFLRLSILGTFIDFPPRGSPEGQPSSWSQSSLSYVPNGKHSSMNTAVMLGDSFDFDSRGIIHAMTWQ